MYVHVFSTTNMQSHYMCIWVTLHLKGCVQDEDPTSICACILSACLSTECYKYIYPVGNKFRYTITLECSGVSFCGCQSQAEAWSVHQLIEEAIYIFSKENVLVTAAGREDTSLNAHHLQT